MPFILPVPLYVHKFSALEQTTISYECIACSCLWLNCQGCNWNSLVPMSNANNTSRLPLSFGLDTATECNRMMQLCETQMIIRMTKHPIVPWYTWTQSPCTHVQSIKDKLSLSLSLFLPLLLSVYVHFVLMSSKHKKRDWVKWMLTSRNPVDH